ncbi:MAG: aldo/keto reductase [Saprospiraceae bacterium]|nr:aldo/keto reductase [Saprospiraceae bacterium]MCB9342432.1 aldo/keto reductase [Lewinellaceae bacterium]
MNKPLLLGTAQWGWTVSRKAAFEELDIWLKAGCSGIDCATNYPINKNPDDFRAAEHILVDYIKAHGLGNLQITMKIGGLDNMRSPESNLHPSFIQMMAGEYRQLFGENLDCLMVHWDNRKNETEICESLAMLASLKKEYGVKPGLSGIKHPETYNECLQSHDLHCDIQLKHNLLHSDLSRYTSVLPSGVHKYFAYGINAGGLKLENTPYNTESTFLARGGRPDTSVELLDQVKKLVEIFNENPNRPAISTMNQLGLIFAGLNREIAGVVVGASSGNQLQETLHYWSILDDSLYHDVYTGLLSITG